jgi:hypothetical protein
VFSFIESLGAEQAEDLQELEEVDLRELASLLKKVQRKKFLRFVGYSVDVTD